MTITIARRWTSPPLAHTVVVRGWTGAATAVQEPGKSDPESPDYLGDDGPGRYTLLVSAPELVTQEELQARAEAELKRVCHAERWMQLEDGSTWMCTRP